MKKIVIRGGKKINGEITVHSAKNSILPILAAVILCSDKVTIKKCPLLSDVKIMLELLSELGCECCAQNESIEINAKNIKVTSGTLNVNTGLVTCEGDFQLGSVGNHYTALNMNHKDGKLLVKGNFTYGYEASMYETCSLTDGILEIKGDFKEQQKVYRAGARGNRRPGNALFRCSRGYFQCL